MCLFETAVIPKDQGQKSYFVYFIALAKENIQGLQDKWLSKMGCFLEIQENVKTTSI